MIIDNGVLETLEEQIGEAFDERRDVAARLDEAVVGGDFLAGSLEVENAGFAIMTQSAQQAADATTVRARTVHGEELGNELCDEYFGL